MKQYQRARRSTNRRGSFSMHLHNAMQKEVLDSEEMVNKLLESKLKGSEPVDTASEGKVNDSDEQTTMDGKNMPDMSDQPQATPFANA